MNEKALKQASMETNLLYMASIAMDLILRNNEWLMAKNREIFRKEKKQVFTRYTKAVRDACFLQDMLMQDIFEVDSANNYKNVQIWQEEANELARLILLFADRSVNQDVVDAIFKFVREQPADGIVDEQLLSNFYLRK